MAMAPKQFFENQAAGFKRDIEHIKDMMERTNDVDDLADLRKKKQWLTDEMMICLKGAENCA